MRWICLKSGTLSSARLYNTRAQAKSSLPMLHHTHHKTNDTHYNVKKRMSHKRSTIALTCHKSCVGKWILPPCTPFTHRLNENKRTNVHTIHIHTQNMDTFSPSTWVCIIASESLWDASRCCATCSCFSDDDTTASIPPSSPTIRWTSDEWSCKHPGVKCSFWAAKMSLQQRTFSMVSFVCWDELLQNIRRFQAWPKIRCMSV